MKKAKLKAQEKAAKRYEEAKADQRRAVIECEEAYLELARLTGDGFPAGGENAECDWCSKPLREGEKKLCSKGCAKAAGSDHA